MLLPRWHRTLENFRDRPAVFLAGRTLRFGDLDDALGTLPPATSPVLAHGSALEIALATLRGWRDGQAVLPLEKADAARPPLDDLPGEVAHLKLTPGNEGRPRAVLFTAAQLAADADRIVEAMELTPSVPNLAAVSLSHSYGFSSVILPMLLHGVPLISVDVPFPAVVAAAWGGHRRVVVPAVPSMWRAWSRSGILDGAPIALAVSAGAPLALDLERAVWERHRLKLHNFYGASECGGISYDDSRSPREEEDDLGSPLPGVGVATDPEGRFLVSSSSVALGYDAARPCERLGDGRFLTPDHGHFRGNRLLLDARGGEAINVAGRKVGPGRIEATLRATGMVARVRVFGVPSPDPERVDEVTALVPPATDLAALRHAAAASLAGWELPRHWVRSGSGADFALPRGVLRERYLAGELGGGD